MTYILLQMILDIHYHSLLLIIIFLGYHILLLIIIFLYIIFYIGYSYNQSVLLKEYNDKYKVYQNYLAYIINKEYIYIYNDFKYLSTIIILFFIKYFIIACSLSIL